MTDEQALRWMKIGTIVCTILTVLNVALLICRVVNG